MPSPGPDAFADLPTLSADGMTVRALVRLNGGSFLVEVHADHLRSLAFKALRNASRKTKEASGALILRPAYNFDGMTPRAPSVEA